MRRSRTDAATDRAPETLWQRVDRVLFALFKGSLRFVLRLAFGFRVRGRVPEDGPMLVVANHSSFLDSLVLGTAVHRRVRFVMTELFAEVPGLRWFFRWNDVILVREGGAFNRELYRLVLESLAKGSVVGIFPEGGISRDGKLQKIQSGVLSIAKRAGVPIVPVGIRGAFEALPRDGRVPKPRTISVRIGDPIPPSQLLPEADSRAESARLGAERLGKEIQALIDRA